MVPFPVWVRNFLVTEVFPASLARAGVAFSNSMSPRVVRTPDAPNCHVAALPEVATSSMLTLGADPPATYTLVPWVAR